MAAGRGSAPLPEPTAGHRPLAEESRLKSRSTPTTFVLIEDERSRRYDLHAEGIAGLDLSADGPIEAQTGAVVEIPVRLMLGRAPLFPPPCEGGG